MKQTFEEIPSPRVYGNSLGAISSWVDEENVENIHNAVLFCHKELNHIIYSEINEIEDTKQGEWVKHESRLVMAEAWEKCKMVWEEGGWTGSM